MRTLRFGALLLLTLIVAGLSYFIVAASGSHPPAAARAPTPVRVIDVQLAQRPSQLPLVGKLQARQSIVITPEVSGRITALPQTASGEWLMQAGIALPILDPESAILIGVERV